MAGTEKRSKAEEGDFTYAFTWSFYGDLLLNAERDENARKLLKAATEDTDLKQFLHKLVHQMQFEALSRLYAVLRAEAILDGCEPDNLVADLKRLSSGQK